jgi:toxin YoeB
VKTAFTDKGWEHYIYWCDHDRKMLARVNDLIRDAKRNPFSGIGKPEPLRNELAGWWSRRITQEHRLVYRVSETGDEQALEVAACRHHY